MTTKKVGGVTVHVHVTGRLIQYIHLTSDCNNGGYQVIRVGYTLSQARLGGSGESILLKFYY